eukprot:4533404-Amphidinium_carterae.1
MSIAVLSTRPATDAKFVCMSVTPSRLVLLACGALKPDGFNIRVKTFSRDASVAVIALHVAVACVKGAPAGGAAADPEELALP